jgi:hypothetical protein
VKPGTKSVVWDRRFVFDTSAELGGPIDVRPLGAAGWKVIRSEVPNLGNLRLPPGAAATLPACWRANRLLAVPGLPAPSSPLISAKFFRGLDRAEI